MEPDSPISNRTRIVFATTGLAIALIGALLAEAAFGGLRVRAIMRASHTASLLFRSDPERIVTQQAQPPPPAPDDSELQKRLDDIGALGGDVQVALAWNNRNDLDLSVQEPGGELIDGYNQSSATGGVMDVDMNSTPENLMSAEAIQRLNRRVGRRNFAHRMGQSDSAPVENIVWPNGKAPLGHYKVFVHQFCNKEQAAQTPYWIVVRVHGKSKRITGAVGRPDYAEQLVDPQLVYEFDVKPETEKEAAAPVVAPSPPAPPRMVTQIRYLLKAVGLALLAAGIWGALLGLLPFALLCAQRFYGRERLWTGDGEVLALLGGPAAGFAAGFLGQALLSLTSAWLPASWEPALLVVGWIVLGGLFGLAAGRITPRMSPVAAPIAGAVSALISSLLFLALSAADSEPAGRLAAAALIGATIGALIAMAQRERIVDEVWEPERPRAPFETTPPFVVRGTRTRKVGGLRRTDRGAR